MHSAGLGLAAASRLWPVGEYQGQWLLITTAQSEENLSLSKLKRRAANTTATMRSGPVTNTHLASFGSIRAGRVKETGAQTPLCATS